jgi:hypothetical protein
MPSRPAPVPPLSPELRTLRQVAGRLQAVVRQRTRLSNQLHQLLALAFPELALLVKDLTAGWVLELLHRSPTAPLLAAASVAEVEKVPYLPQAQSDALLQQARTSIASLTDATVAELVRDQIRQLRDGKARQKHLENLLVSAYSALPAPNRLDTIPDIGAVTAAVLTAFILDIDRFETPGKLVAYFGVLPIEASSGVERDGTPRGPKRYIMSRRGNDLVRRYLWMAGLSAVQHNPAVRALYARVVAKRPDQKAVAIGHAMRKLLHLAFAVWKSGKPFDPQHNPWGQESGIWEQESAGAENTDMPRSQQEQAARLRSPAQPVRNEVSTVCPTTRMEKRAVDETVFIDFAHLKTQLSMAQVLDQLGLLSRLKGTGPQRKGPCPLHRGDGRGRTFSVNLDKNVFHCLDAGCAKKGDVIDLWASVNGMSLRQAALDLIRTFHLESAPE